MISKVITSEDFEYLCKALGIHDEYEKAWLRMGQIGFKTFYENTKKQPISSFIRAMELKCRELWPVFHESFNILYETMSSEHTNAKNGSCWLFPDMERFRIILPPKVNEIEKRNIIAHEIGHLYSALKHLRMTCYDTKGVRIKDVDECRKILMDCLHARDGEKHRDYDNRANAIGVFILNERAKFHTNKMRVQERDFCKKTTGIIDDFVEIKKNKKWLR